MIKEWKLREKISENLEEQLLFHRGIKTKEEVEKFFNPSYEKDLRDPFGLLNMDKVVDRILKAIKRNEKIVIYGDYDADGICSCVIFHDFFKKIGFDNFRIYIPDRYQGGYGLNSEIIKEFVEEGINLIITIDCGITDVKETLEINKNNIEVVIIDHHLPPSELPKATAILDPFQEKEKYPFKSFCGSGLAFKTICALIKSSEFKINPGWEKWLLDVVAIATIADMVPLIDENRVLVFYGLEVLKKTRRQGLLSLFRKLQLYNSSITEDDIAFSISPCINVASRMEHATISYSLLTTESREEAESLSQKLIDKNQERKKTTEDILKKISNEINELSSVPEIIVMGEENWPVGILAPLANKVLEKYGRPVFLWGRGGITTEIKGSCRSNGSINLVEILRSIGEKIFTEFGGHTLAAGFSIKEGKIKDLEKEIKNVCKKLPHQETEPQIYWIDSELGLEKINWSLIDVLEKFQPFGVGNPKPVFIFSDLVVFDTRMFGNGGIHLQVDFRKNSGEVISAIGFFMEKHPVLPISRSSKINLISSIEKSMFKGYPELRMRIVDIKNSQ